MRYLMIVLCLLTLVGCSSHIDFTEEQKVMNVSSYQYKSYYYLECSFPNVQRYIVAKPGFANPGDIIVCEDGVIKVVKE